MSRAAGTALFLCVAATAASPGGGRCDRIALAAEVASPPDAAATVPRRATGGIGILATLHSASAVVTGVVSHPRKIDLHGWSAELRVDQVLAGKAALGDTLTMAWEELSTSRPARFADGDRVLVVLAPLPTQSLWRKRFTGTADTHKVMIVAGGGDAFLLAPDGGTVNVLGHYLAMAPNAREGEPGQKRLAELVATGHPSVAAEALEQLENTAAPLGVEAIATLLEAARDARRETVLRARALALAARQDSPAVRETAARLAEAGSPIRAQAYLVLAGLPGGLPADRVAALLAAPEPELRIVGVRCVADSGDAKRLLEIARKDAAGPVRFAAATALISRNGASTIPDLIPMLDDPDAAVRNGVGSAIGSLGAVAVEPLRTVVDTGSERAALAAVRGLARAGQEGGVALVAVSHLHPNEAVKAFAKLAVGRGIGHEH